MLNKSRNEDQKTLLTESILKRDPSHHIKSRKHSNLLEAKGETQHLSLPQLPSANKNLEEIGKQLNDFKLDPTQSSDRQLTSAARRDRIPLKRQANLNSFANKNKLVSVQTKKKEDDLKQSTLQEAKVKSTLQTLQKNYYGSEMFDLK